MAIPSCTGMAIFFKYLERIFPVEKSKILVVDDNSKIQYAFQSFLEKEGYISIAAKGGSNVLNIIARENPSLDFLEKPLSLAKIRKILE